jgi:hypothetical protein
VLTGTPLENRLEELLSLVQFVDRFRLGPTFRLLHEHQIRDENGKVVGYRHLDRIGKTLEPILVRRHKDEVLDQLPERIDNNIFVPMTELQMKHHKENHEIVARIVEKWRRYRFLTEADQRRLMIALQRMRMSCDSSYLVDHFSDHGTKADEALTVLEEVLEGPGAKVVVFSQWLRMHELIERRLRDRRRWTHEMFHGGLTSGRRKQVLDRFREDPKCRVLLSTDAGGVGLNLQHATMVMNMDLPWNPAVLEQRIGRVHRLGQNQPVRVVNFVAQGTIEEGMLAVLKFKKSLFEGVLDGGAKEVFLGGSRLNKFMESVASATAAIPEAFLEDAEEALVSTAGEDAGAGGRRRGGRQPQALPVPAALPEIPLPVPSALAGSAGALQPGAFPAAPAGDAWSGLLQNGLALLQQFVLASRNGSAEERPSNVAPRPGLPHLARDATTGETFVKLPLPAPEVIDQALQALGSLLQSLRR